MAVVDKYINIDAETGDHPYPSNQLSGAGTVSMAVSFEKAAGDTDGSVYRIFKSLPATLVPIDIKIFNDALAGATAVKLGVYKAEKGAKISEDLLAATLDLSSAHNAGEGLNALAIDNALVGKNLEEMLNAKLSKNDKYGAVDICLTGATLGSAAGTIAVVATFVKS